MRWWNWIPRRFSLRLLLLAMLGPACLSAWYGNRMHSIQRERERLHGSWGLVTINGENQPPGLYHLDFGENDATVVYPPRYGVGRIDFLMPDGIGGTWVSHAIYRFENSGTILFAQNDADKPQPLNFDRAHCDSLFVARPRK